MGSGASSWIPRVVPYRFAGYGGRLWVVESGVDTNGTVSRVRHSPDGKTWSDDPDPPGVKPLDELGNLLNKVKYYFTAKP